MRKLTECIGPAFYGIYRDIVEGRHTHYWLSGGRGSLKSSFCGIVIPLGIMQDPNAHAVVYRKVYGEVGGSVFEQLLWGIEMLGVSHLWKYTKTPIALEYKPTGQRIVFRGADDPQKSKSIKFRKGYPKYIWFEELTEFAGMEEIRVILQSLIRGGETAIVLYSYNPPKSAQNWVNAESMLPRDDRLVHKSTYLQAPREWLGPKFFAEAEQLKKTNERAYRHEYLGEVTGTGGQVFNNLAIGEIDEDIIKRADRIYIGLDFGFAVDPDACTKWYYDRKNRKLYALEEFYSIRTPSDELCRCIKTMTGEKIVTCDSAEPRMIGEIRRAGVKAMPAKKGPDSIEHGIRWLQNLAAIVIDPERTPNIAREFAGYEYKQDKYGNFVADYPDANNHTIDATRYAMEAEANVTRAKTINRAGLGL